MIRISICLALIMSMTSALIAQNELSLKRALLTQKQNQLYTTEQKISVARAEHSINKEHLTSVEKNQKDKQFDYENKKNAFNRAIKNVDLVSNDKINTLSNEYKVADAELRQANEQLQQMKLKKQEASQKLEQAISEKSQLEKDILSLNADIFDIQLREPVWAIGEAVCNLAEDETPDNCRKRALEAAQRDAMEKAGKMVLESETIVRNYQMYVDEIRTHLKAQIMEQDSDPAYGIKREVLGDNIRYVGEIFKCCGLEKSVPMALCGTFYRFIDRFTVDEFFARKDKRKQFERAQFFPSFLCLLCQFEYHGQSSIS